MVRQRAGWFRATGADQSFTVALDVPQAGVKDLSAAQTVAADYGTTTVSVDSTQIGDAFDAYRDRLGIEPVEYGEVALEPGAHELTLRVTGRNPAARGHSAGVDFLELELVDASR